MRTGELRATLPPNALMLALTEVPKAFTDAETLANGLFLRRAAIWFSPLAKVEDEERY